MGLPRTCQAEGRRTIRLLRRRRLWHAHARPPKVSLPNRKGRPGVRHVAGGFSPTEEDGRNRRWTPTPLPKGSVRRRDSQQWVLDWIVKTTGRVQNFERDERIVPAAAKSYRMAANLPGAW